MKCLIYGLASSYDLVIRYIGQTKTSLEERLRNHFYDAKSNDKKMNRKINVWIRDQISGGYSVVTIPICIGKWNETEKNCINSALSKGWALLNQTRGGQGGDTFELTGRCLSRETREKISKSNKGRIPKTAGWNKGIPMSEDAKKKMVASKTGKKLTEEHKEKLKGRPPWNKGRPWSEEERKVLSDAHKGLRGNFKGKTHSEETKRKLSEAGIGRTCSEETKRKRSESIKEFWRKRHAAIG